MNDSESLTYWRRKRSTDDKLTAMAVILTALALSLLVLQRILGG